MAIIISLSWNTERPATPATTRQVLGKRAVLNKSSYAGCDLSVTMAPTPQPDREGRVQMLFIEMKSPWDYESGRAVTPAMTDRLCNEFPALAEAEIRGLE